MRIILTFLLNAGLNFGVGLVVAAVLGPTGYGRFAVGLSTGTLMATALFDWLRLSATRFYGERQRSSEPNLRATFDRLYVAGAAVLLCATLAAFLLPLPSGLTAGFVAAVALTAVANGAFDFRTALARACFRDDAYAILVIGKGVGSLALAVGTALLSHDPLLTLAALALGTVVAVLPVRGSLAEPQPGLPERRLARRFAHYGLPIVAANVVFQAILLLNRSVAAARYGYAGAGHLSLVTDIELRLLLAVGAAVDVLLFQLAVRREAQRGAGAALDQVRRNMVHVAAVVVLLAVGLAAALPAFSALIVPSRFQDGFAPLALIMLPGMALFCLGQFGINPVFQMAHRTAPIILGAVVAAVLDGLGLLALPDGAGLAGLAAVHSSSLAGGFLVLALLALRDPAVRPRAADMAGLLVAGAATLAAVWPTRWIATPALSLLAAGALGTIVYGTALVILDVGDARVLARRLVGRDRRPADATGFA